MPRSANAQCDGIDGITRPTLPTLPLDPRIGRQGTTLGLSAERKTLGHVDGRTRPGPGIHKAGNDCDASEAGLQGEQARR
jgi:hypothetical protein